MEENKMKKLVSLLLVSILVLGLVACAPADSDGSSSTQVSDQTQGTDPIEETDTYGGTLDVAWVGEGASSYSVIQSGNASYVWTTAVFEGILSRDSEGNLQPGVCDFTLSEDQLTLTLTPRKGLKFHNGKEVSIDDIWASIIYNKDPKMEDYVRYMLASDPVMDYDTNTITLTFSEYNASTLYYLSQNATYLPVVPLELWQKYSTDKTNDEMDALTTESYDPWDEIPEWEIDGLIGTGPYKVDADKWEQGYKIVLVRNEDYVQKEGLQLTGMAGPRYAYFDVININYNSEENAVAMGLLNGTYDVASVSISQRESLLNAGLQSYADASKKIVYMAFNTGSHTMQDENLRKALAAAIDYDTLMAIAYGEGTYTLETSMMAEGAYWTNKFSEADYAGESNMELAQQYLAKSAYAGETIKFMYDDKQADLAVYIKSVVESLGLTYAGEAKSNADWKTAYAYPEDYDFDMIVAASAQSELLPSNLVTNLRVRFWQCDIDYANAAFKEIGGLIYGSDDSLKLWDEMSDKWVNDAHIVPLGCTVGSWYADPDLCVQFPGSFVAFYNSYWKSPENRA